MHNQKLFVLFLLLTAAAAVSSDVDVEAADSDGNTISTSTPGIHQLPRNLVKRAPTSSFIGMRGKKEQEAAADVNWLGPDPIDYGEDGESNFYNENGQRLKKAPMAFVGVRGKKFSTGNSHLRDLIQNMEEERIRESFLQDFLERLAIDGGDVGKRAPTGFTGMRGKRPTMANGEVSDDEVDALELLEKRAPVNSFVGVRGKKDVSHQHYKRAALSELWRKLFKKAYDVRGKKQRYADLNNKFVAVRGKKSDLMIDDDLEQNVVHPWVYLIGEKRAPNGFLGMRGKRPVIEE
ncbi:LOW QUALITY PROTEIN: tachykinins [Drosophila nasuta]|uniref:LOW QUALITY PROTEIN: tachykinins n=1 Tax=Drosophila nasuta TaxID=42062 RepID=UPI00295F1E48|nr:LOW QUALITY PROTEIN: tachykinins [Drosophila nasuta]